MVTELQTDRHRTTLYYRLAASPLASRGFAPRDDKKNLGEIRKGPRKSPPKKKKKEKKKKRGGFFFFWGVGGVPPPKKIA